MPNVGVSTETGSAPSPDLRNFGTSGALAAKFSNGEIRGSGTAVLHELYHKVPDTTKYTIKYNGTRHVRLWWGPGVAYYLKYQVLTNALVRRVSQLVVRLLARCVC